MTWIVMIGYILNMYLSLFKWRTNNSMQYKYLSKSSPKVLLNMDVHWKYLDVHENSLDVHENMDVHEKS